MKLFKSFLWAFLALSCIFPLYRFCHKQTDGFTTRKIRTSFQDHTIPHLSSSLSEEEKEGLKKILNQPLHYIGRGGQCYAFATQDDQYVVKLLKYNNNYPRIWFTLCSFPLGFETYRQAQIERKLKKLEGEYRSYQIALKDLQQETGILYMHLDKGDLPDIKLDIFDKIKVRHSLKADSFQFYVQKKGVSFYPELKKLIEAKAFQEAEKALDQMSSYLVKRSKKKIVDKDNGIWRNFAFYKDEPFQIDIGQFVYEPKFENEKEYIKNLLCFTKEFRTWLATLSPSLADYFELSLQKQESLAPN